jgi:DNA methylase
MLAFQGWRSFKEAFAPELVKRAIDETAQSLGRAPLICADPFGGSGTTALACQFLGIRSTTIEVNPFLCDLIASKLETYEYASLRETYLSVLRVVDEVRAEPANVDALPDTFIEPGVDGRFLFWADVAGRFWEYSSAITQVASSFEERRLLKTLLTACGVSVSNAVVSGKGRRYRSGWEARRPTPAWVDVAFREAVTKAFFDIRRFQDRACRDYVLVQGDARVSAAKIGPIDVAVFSPPYPNSFDYTDVYNIELWMGGYLGSKEDNRSLREQTVRSHVQIRRSFEAGRSSSPLLGDCYEQLDRARHSLWNRDIPSMVVAYFDDLRVTLAGLTGHLDHDGRLYVVVGDSRYANVDIPVAKILAEQVPDLGLRVIASEPFRSMRASPQQGGREELSETLVVLTHC